MFEVFNYVGGDLYTPKTIKNGKENIWKCEKKLHELEE